jgi:hypothetical protein
MPTVVRGRNKKSSKKPARTRSTAETELASWSESKKKRMLQMLVREFLRDGSDSIYLEGVGFITPMKGQARLVKLDDSTPHLREMRRRAETLDDSIPIEQIIEERKKRAKNQE